MPRPSRPIAPEQLLLPVGTAIALVSAVAWTWADWVQYGLWTGYGLRTGLVALGATLLFYGVLRLARRHARSDA